jgi:hypothetical protein
MQEEPSTLITCMNRSYNALYGTLCPETRRKAETTFYRCQNGLRQRGMTFHQTLAGQWVLDTAHSQALASSAQLQRQEDGL